MLVWGAQLELGSTASTYQQIVTPEISFLQYQSQPVLYTDSAGTTPVTAVEQAVGLMLDKSKGLVLGANVVTNGNFSQGSTGWTAGAGWTIGGGVASATASTGDGLYDSGTTYTPGTWYRIQFTKTGTANVVVYIRTSAAPFSTTASGVITAYVLAGSGVRGIEFYLGGAGTITNISAQALPGNHAFQTTSAKRPVLRARYNLLTYSEQFDNAVWTANNVSVTPNVAVAPDGTTTADKIIPNTTNTAHNFYQSFTYVAGTYTLAFFAKASGYFGIRVGSMFTGNSVMFDLNAGTVGTATAGYTGTITSVGNGWYRCAVNWTASAGADLPGFYVMSNGSTTVFAGNGTDGIFVWGADLRPTSQATGLIGPTYQRIAAATDYDVVGYLSYLAFDGVDDALTTNSIDFTATDKMTVFAGVRKLNDTGAQIYAEISADINLNVGSFVLVSGTNNVVGFEGTSRGSAVTALGTTGRYAINAPVTAVVTDIFDISAPLASIRVNGLVGTNGTSSQGTGNYGNYPLFIGARNQTSLYFNGWLTQLIGRGASTTAGQISATESYVGVRTGVQL